MPIAFFTQAAVSTPAVSYYHGASIYQGLNLLFKDFARNIRDMGQAYSANAFLIPFSRNQYNVLALRAPASFAGFFSSDICFIDFNCPAQLFPMRVANPTRLFRFSERRYTTSRETMLSTAGGCLEKQFPVILKFDGDRKHRGLTRCS